MSDEDIDVVKMVERRRRGRPRSEEPCAAVMTWLPAPAHDRLIEIAKRNEMSVSETIRRIVIFTLQK